LENLRSKVNSGTLEYVKDSSLGLSTFVHDWAPSEAPITTAVQVLETTYQALCSQNQNKQECIIGK
jgi:hypothetical protein